MIETREMNHPLLGTEHLLIGLMGEEKGIAAQVLNARLHIEQVRAEVLRVTGDQMLGDDGLFPRDIRPSRRSAVKWEYKLYSHQQPSGMLFRGAGDIPVDQIAEALNALGAEGWEAVGVFPIAMAQGATNMIGILLKRAVT